MHALSLGRHSFASLLTTLAALLLVVLFARLGVWQLHRADETRALETAMAAQARLPPLDLNRGIPAADELRALVWRSVTVRGTWQTQQQVLLDNQTRDARVGYSVFTLLYIDGCRCAVLVDRGWIAAAPDRSTAPDVSLSATAVTVSGVLAPLPFSGLGLRSDVEPLAASSLLRVQQLDLARIPIKPGWRLLPLVLQLSPAAPDGYQRNWHRPALRAERHVAYAVQWFIFALITAALYLGLSLKHRVADSP